MLPSVKLLSRYLPPPRSSGSWSRWPPAPKWLKCCFSLPTTELYSFVVKGFPSEMVILIPCEFSIRVALVSRVPPSFCPFVTVSFELCLTLCLCVFSPVVLRVGLCLVWISEDRSRSASAPTLGTVMLHVCPCQPWALTAANSCLWPHTPQSTARHRALHWNFCPSLKGVFM